MTATLERSEQATAWELRGHWAARRRVVLTLASRRGSGRTGVGDGSVRGLRWWHIPTVDILRVARPHHSQKAASESYRRTAA